MLVATFSLLAALVPLNDLGPRDYAWGFLGGLWDNGSNEMPADHLAEGLARAKRIVPLDVNGNPSPDGKIVFLAAGFDQTSRIFCGTPFAFECQPDSFTSLALRETRVNRDHLVFLNAASHPTDAVHWATSEGPYERTKNTILAPAGVTELQVQAAWVQLINMSSGYFQMPNAAADSYMVKRFLAGTAMRMKARYPNLQILYISSAAYAGYATTNFIREPTAYQTGLSVRWIVTAQVETMRLAGVGPYWDSTVGDLNYDKNVVPWLTWGPYLWANGTEPRSDGLTWELEDFEADGSTLSERGAAKGARLLMNFLLREPSAAGWFASPAPPTPGRTRGVRH